MQKLREEVRNLRDEVQNKLILEEQVHDLNTRLEHYRNQDKKFSALQVRNIKIIIQGVPQKNFTPYYYS